MTRRRLGRRRRLLFAAVAVALALGALEVVLTLAGVQYARTPRLMKQAFVDDYIGWQNQNIELLHFQPHPARMWAPVPGVGVVNEDGLQGPRLPRERAAGRARVLFLGDSCTTAVPDGYPALTVEALGRRGITAEPLVAACGGYSTWQGAHFLEEALAWRPDVVVAYFGWNDHWVSALPDHAFVPTGALGRLAGETVGRLRTYQLLHRLIHPPAPTGLLPRDAARLAAQARVPPAEFTANVRRITARARAAGLRVVWVVAPIAPHVVETDKSVLIGHTDLVPAVHALYARLLREAVADEPDALLLDLPAFDRRTMLADGIHPSPAGNALIGEALAEVLARALTTGEGERR
ncbi:MAG: SGNH/GDSL hydrolase family protein [Planctomycetes bacterium]|nr:SGNH/GDSL hydrolase family protein [Planctomycetota bacterium]